MSKIKIKVTGSDLEKSIENYLIDCKVRSLSEATIYNYEHMLNDFRLSLGKLVGVNDLESNDVSNYILYLRAKGNNDISIKNKLKILKAFFKYNNLDIDIPKIKTVESHKLPYTDEEMTLLLAKPKRNSFPQWRNYTIANFLIGTGVRCATISEILIKDLDFTNNTIFLRKVKNGGQYTIPMSSDLKSVLRQYLSLYDHSDDDMLFPSLYGDKMSRTTIKQAMREYNHSRGVSRCSIHLYRHTFAYNCIRQGMPLPVLQKILGHSNISTTMQYLNISIVDMKHQFDNYCPLDSIRKKAIKLKK